MKRSRGYAAVMAVMACLVLGAVTAPASAHVAKDVGDYTLVVGWGSEPAYAGQQNSVQLEVSKRSVGKPVVNLGDSLKVTVTYGERSTKLSLVPEFDLEEGFGTPGDYRAWFFPTAPGDYTFHFTGTIGTQAVDESFTSSPKTFSPVEDPGAAQFPVKAPSSVMISQRLNAEMSRVATQSEVSSARTLAMIGIAVGVLGLVVGGAAFLRKRA